MQDKGTSKKLTNVGDENTPQTTRSTQPFVVTDESRGRAKSLRLFAILSWVVAIAFEVMAILWLRKVPVSMAMLIVFIGVDLIFAVVGNVLWQKSNRLDPASEKDKTRFFLQSQLGVIMSVIAFLPLVILIFTNKNMNGKQKGIVGSIAVVALLIAGVTGIDFNPPSQEKYAEQTKQVEVLMGGVNNVYWTKSGKSYHLFQDCPYINSSRTTEIFQGTVAQARELKNITDICNLCQSRAEKGKTTIQGTPEVPPVGK